MGTSSCASTHVYPYEHYYYDRPNDALVGRTDSDDKPASSCDPSSEYYYSCIVYRPHTHGRLKADYLKLLIENEELKRRLNTCK